MKKSNYLKCLIEKNFTLLMAILTIILVVTVYLFTYGSTHNHINDENFYVAFGSIAQSFFGILQFVYTIVLVFITFNLGEGQSKLSEKQNELSDTQNQLSKAQNKLIQKQIDLLLFEKRYKIYNELTKLCNYISRNNLPPYAPTEKSFRIYKESINQYLDNFHREIAEYKFLFDDDTISFIDDFVDNKVGVITTLYIYNIENGKMMLSDAKSAKMNSSNIELYLLNQITNISEEYNNITDVFKKYLDFKTID